MDQNHRITEFEQAMCTALIVTLQQATTTLLARIKYMEHHRNRNSNTPSTSAPANPLGVPKLPANKTSRGTRKPLGTMVKPDRIVAHHPTAFRHCDSTFTDTETEVGRPIRHQITEPPLSAPRPSSINCTDIDAGIAKRTRAPNIQDIGPRLTALVALLSGRYCLFRRELAALLKSAYDCFERCGICHTHLL